MQTVNFSKNCLITCFLAIFLCLMPMTANAEKTRLQNWPTGWKNPLGTTKSNVQVTANYGSLSRGCSNADVSHDYTYYEESGTTAHVGLDLHASNGDPVYAIGDGEVTKVGFLWGKEWEEVLLAEHRAKGGARFTVAYGHVKIGTNPRTRKLWGNGDAVMAGEQIGTIETLRHLHVGLAADRKTNLPGMSNSSIEKGECVLKSKVTQDPVDYLNSRVAKFRAEISGGIVGWLNPDGSITSWQVKENASGELGRYWIPDSDTYWCIRKRGGEDWGARPARFLDQLPDQSGEHAQCP